MSPEADAASAWRLSAVLSCSRATLTEVMSYLELNQIITFAFGGWAEELRALIGARPHRDLDLLYPSDGFSPIDKLIARCGVQEIQAKRAAHKRAIVVDDVMVEIFLVRTDLRGPHTLFWDRVRHDWPTDVFGEIDGLRVASVASLDSYRRAHSQIHASIAT